jgi:hypothetical protein
MKENNMTKEKNIMEDYIRSIIKEELKEFEIVLKEAEAKKIVEAIIPHLDKLVAERIKLHFSSLAKLVQQKFGESDKESG